MTKKRYVIETADVALPWQKFHRILDKYTGETVVESNDEDKLKRIVCALERDNARV